MQVNIVICFCFFAQIIVLSAYFNMFVRLLYQCVFATKSQLKDECFYTKLVNTWIQYWNHYCYVN